MCQTVPIPSNVGDHSLEYTTRRHWLSAMEEVLQTRLRHTQLL